MIYRVYVEKKPELAHEAAGLLKQIREFVGVTELTGLRLLNRYDAEGVSEELFNTAISSVFSEPQLDITYRELPAHDGAVLAVEYLPGQFDQRADSAAQCLQIISQGERPTVQTAKVYLLSGALDAAALAKIEKYLINPVECRKAGLEMPATLQTEYAIPEAVAVLNGFIAMDEAAMQEFRADYGLAMDLDDLRCCRNYFAAEHRDPTITEIRVLDTYWSDHCRHTTFNTVLEQVSFEDALLQGAWDEYIATRQQLNRTKPITLMDLGTIAARALKAQGILKDLDESDEINACTVKVKIEVDGEEQDWLLLFKNETHNHPTEIEPFGGAATCIGGAIRDPLSGRSYVYAAMRVTGAADPLAPVSATLTGKLPQRQLVTTAAAGYSSYGNQIGLATGHVDEIYHPGYAAKRMEVGAVLGAAPAANVRREVPAPGDVVILLGGKTGRDGCGGATGSSKSHTTESLESCGAEVQKGNAPEERKLQRLFRNAEASLLIKRCNDFGAGGVSVAIGELADGLDIDLDAVPKKYAGLDGTELAISESQERMAVVVEAKDAARFAELAAAENLESTVVATVTEAKRLVMHWNGQTIVDISRDFLDTNGAPKATAAHAVKAELAAEVLPADFVAGMKAVADDLNTCSHQGMAERFDSTIGSGNVLMPFGGSRQKTPTQAMAYLLPLLKGSTEDCSFMAWGFDPFISEMSPYHGAYLAVVQSVARLVASGAAYHKAYLSFQEYFPRLGSDAQRWGLPLAALLGAFRAQMGLGLAAIGGKDSMSGSFEQLDVPPTLISFAVAMGKAPHALPNHFKAAGHRIALLQPVYDENGLPAAASLKALFDQVHQLIVDGKALAAYTPGHGGVAAALLKMSLGEGIGVALDADLATLFGRNYGAFVIELADDAAEVGTIIGKTAADGMFRCGEACVALAELEALHDGKLESVYPTKAEQPDHAVTAYTHTATSWPTPLVKTARPKALIPAFPGTNCEVDTARALEKAGAEAEIFVIKNLSSADISRSVEGFAAAARTAQMIVIPGGFSGGDEPDGSAKFIISFFRNPAVKDAVEELLSNRDGLMAGICNGFQALVKLGLVPYGHIVDADASNPTLTFNCIGRHQSRLVRTRVASNKSPWLALTKPGEVYTVPISHGEGRFLASPEQVAQLAANGQIACQYVDEQGVPTMDILHNPNGSIDAIEAITSPDGRVLGKMGHSERVGKNLYRNVNGLFELRMFESAVKYFKG